MVCEWRSGRKWKSWASFTVRNLDETLPFFTEVLGFVVTSRDTRDPKVIEAITGVAGAEVEVAYVRVHEPYSRDDRV